MNSQVVISSIDIETGKIKLATSHKNTDNGWLLFFKAGKLVRIDYWMAC